MRDVESMLAEAIDSGPQFDPWKLRCWRELRGLTQLELAKALGWSESGNETISRIESWKLNVGQRRHESLARVLRCKLTDLSSVPSQLAKSRARYDEWCAAGSPPLRAWLARAKA